MPDFRVQLLSFLAQFLLSEFAEEELIDPEL